MYLFHYINQWQNAKYRKENNEKSQRKIDFNIRSFDEFEIGIGDQTHKNFEYCGTFLIHNVKRITFFLNFWH